jgi:NAD(P)-dependent dehydrogenase (short-subunit alcohol dehydrogenase family)
MTEAGADPLDFTGRAVIVTGGTKGVGLGIARRFLTAGADVVVTARSEPDELPSEQGRTASFVAADVRDPEQANAVVDFAVERLGRLDALVNNAGGAPPADAATVSPRFTEAIIRLNLIAPMVLAQAANAVMQAQDDGGSVINICSVSGTRPSPGSAAYGAAKAGLLNLTTSLAIEWAPKVRVNAVTPGYIETEKSHLYYGDEEGVAAVASIIPLLRMGAPNDIGDACVFLASPLAAYVSGSNLAVHGGGERPPFLSASNAS